MDEPTDDAATVSEHVQAIRRRLWWVVVGSLLGLVLGALTLRGEVSSNAVAQVSIEYRWDAAEVAEPGSDAKDATLRREQLIPDLESESLKVEGQDESRRIVFEAVSSDVDTATENAMEYATAYRDYRQADIDKRLDAEIALQKSALDVLQEKLDTTAQLTPAAVDDAALVLEVILRTRRLSDLTQALGPNPIMGNPELVFTKSSPIGVNSTVPVLLLIILGGGVAASLAAFAGRLDHRLYSRADLERVVRGRPVLAVVEAGSDVSGLLPAVASLTDRYAPGAVVGIVGVGKDVGRLVSDVGRSMKSGAATLSDDSASHLEFQVIDTSLSDDAAGLVQTRSLDGVLIVSQAGTTQDTDLAAAVSSLGLIGTDIAGLVMIGVPARELAEARLSQQL
jgi:hypothetical protein